MDCVNAFNGRVEMPVSGPLRFIDLFAGAGGLSLGLMQAGLSGLFAVEKSPHAFATLKANLIEAGPDRPRFLWPEGLAPAPFSSAGLLAERRDYLAGLAGQVDLVVGGPPCQGFSLAGLRRAADPRNNLIYDYLTMVRLIRPAWLVLENVEGFTIGFREGPAARRLSAASHLVEEIRKLGYPSIDTALVDCLDYGLPQARRRYIMVAGRDQWAVSPLALMAGRAGQFRSERGLPDRPVSAREALSDLETVGRHRERVTDGGPMGAQAAVWRQARRPSSYQVLIRAGLPAHVAPPDRRLAAHSEATRTRLAMILAQCERGKKLSRSERARFNLKKQRIYPLAPDSPAPTLTSVPDDIIHYAEPRVLTVREYARLQSFPDWYAFSGPYTTGGAQRRYTVPRYTQVANAVPPLLGRALGEGLLSLF